MALEDQYDSNIAYNPDSEELITGAVFQVFAPDDSAYATPLPLTDPASGAGIPTLRSSNIGVLPSFRVAGDLPQVILKSGSFITQVTSRYGLLLDVVPDPTSFADGIAAAQAARAAAEAARDAVPDMVPPLVTDALENSAPLQAAVATRVDEEVETRALISGGDERLPQPSAPDPDVVRSFTDNLNRSLLAFLSTGTVRIPSLLAMFSELGEVTATSVNGVAYETGSDSEISGYTRVIVDQEGRVLLGLRPDWTWHIPFLETNSEIEALPPTHYRSTYSSTSRKIVSGSGLTTAGHSMLNGAHAAIAAAVAGLVSGITNLSVGGETSRTIAARQGGQPMLILPVGGEFPASGSVDVTLRWADGAVGGGWPLLQGPASYAVTAVMLDGTKVPGTLGIVRDPAAMQYVHHAGDRYTFTRTTPGASIPAARPLPIYYDVATPRWGDIFLYWMARNNITETDQAIGDLQAMIQRQEGLDKRFLVLSEHNGSNELTGSANWNAVMAFNARARALFGRRFIDTRQYLIDYGLADAGITPTTQDNTDIANGVVPSSLRGDNLHLNAAGSAVVAQLVRRRLLELEWITA